MSQTAALTCIFKTTFFILLYAPMKRKAERFLPSYFRRLLKAISGFLKRFSSSESPRLRSSTRWPPRCTFLLCRNSGSCSYREARTRAEPTPRFPGIPLESRVFIRGQKSHSRLPQPGSRGPSDNIHVSQRRVERSTFSGCETHEERRFALRFIRKRAPPFLHFLGDR